MTAFAKVLSSWPKAALPALTLVLAGWALARPSPMLVNLGAGDEPFARGFQDWERAGRDARTMFRWSRDGARIEVPATVHAEALRLRVRLARFLPHPVELTWRVNGRDAVHQTVAPRGWHVETLDLGAVHGPLVLDLRTPGDPDGLGAAIDWVEISGAERVMPRWSVLAGVLLLMIVLPMAAHLVAGTGAAHTLEATVLLAIPFVLHLDPAQGLVAVAKAAPAALLGAIVLAAVSRFRPGEFQPAFAASIVTTTLASLLLLHPAFFYPDVDTHARLLAAIRQEPSLAIDPSPYQQRTGAWTRSLGGEKVAFPYSPVFHVAAWPLALFFGNVDAIKILAALALGTSVLGVHVLARALGLPIGAAVLAQVLFATMLVHSSRLFLALFPALFAQALEIALLLAFVRVLPALDRRASVLLGAQMAATQIAYTGSLVNVAAVTAMLVPGLWIAGERTAARRLAVIGTVSTALIAALLYGRFLPVLWTNVLPHSGGGTDADTADVWTGPLRRAFHFFGVGFPVLVVVGIAVRQERGDGARRVLLATLLAGAVLLGLRGLAPALVRDVKEIELLAAPVAVFAAAALLFVAARKAGRVLAAGIVAALILRGLHEAVAAYTAGIVALDR